MKLLNLLLAIGVTTTSFCFAQISRTVMVQSNNSELLYPLNFFTANAGVARVGLGLAAHATNPTVQLTNGGTGATNAATARTNLGLGLGALTNSNAASFREAISAAAATNFGGGVGPGAANRALTLVNNDTGATVLEYDEIGGDAWVISDPLDFRDAIGLPFTALTNTNASTFRSAVGLGAAWLTNTTLASFRAAVLPAYSGNTNRVLSVNSNGTDVEWVVQSVTSSVTYPIALTNGGTGATNAATARTNLGLGATNDVEFKTVLAGAGGSTNPTLRVGNSNTGFYLEGGPNRIRAVVDGTNSFAALPDKISAPTAEFTTINISGNGGNIMFTHPSTAAITRTNLELGEANDVTFKSLVTTNAGAWVTLTVNGGLIFSGSTSNSAAAATRTNLGLPLSALTNTSNVTMMRALSGSTDTNHPFSGSVSVVGTNNTNTLVFSNGILQSVQ